MKTFIVRTIAISSLSAAILLNVACAPTKSNDLMAPAPNYSQDKAVGDGLTIQFNPRVDILFVIDNSKTMLDEQEKLKAASASFVEKLGANSVIDYRVGVITVYDDTHCGQSCFPAGKLRSPFISRSEQAPDQIKAALNIGIQELKDGGPQFEELFTPILAAVSPQMNQINGSFIRNDSRVVIVMITDESDSSLEYSVDDFISGLQVSIGLNRLDLYSIVTTNEKDRNNQQRDRAPVRIENAIALAEGNKEIALTKMFNIQGNYGSHLGAIVTDIRKRVLSQQIQLPSEPEKNTIKLYYLADNEQPSAQNEVTTGWSYNAPFSGSASKPTITINDDIKVDFAPNKRFRAVYVKIEEFSRAHDKVKSVTVTL